MTTSSSTIKLFWLLLLSMGPISSIHAQIENEQDADDIDVLLDQILFSDDQLVDDILQDAYRYNILYSSLTFNSNTYYYGRENTVDQFNLMPQLSYSSSMGIVAGVSGVYFDAFEPKWSHTNLSAGYFNYIGKKELFRYYVGYSHTIFTDGWDSLNNSIDVIAGLRNNMRTLGMKIYGYYLFGNGNSYQVIGEVYGNFTLLDRRKFKIKHRPEVNFTFGQQIWYSYFRPHNENWPNEQQYNGLLNTQLSIPFYIVTKSWDVEIGYSINFPTNYKGGETNSPTGFFSISVGYLIDFSK